MGERLIAYECIAPDHRPGAARPDKLTVHEGEWAFCCFDAFADGHSWRATGGIELATLMRNVGLAIGPARQRTDGARVKTPSGR